MTLVDNSGASGQSISVSLWTGNARLTNYQNGQVMAIKGARVSDYNGRTLNSGEEHSQVIIDPDHPKAKELQKWKRSSQTHRIHSLSTQVFKDKEERSDNQRLVAEMVE